MSDHSDVKIDHVGFQLKAIIDEWIEDHGWNVLGGSSALPNDYYLEIGSKPLEQGVNELRLIFYVPEA